MQNKIKGKIIETNISTQGGIAKISLPFDGACKLHNLFDNFRVNEIEITYKEIEKVVTISESQVNEMINKVMKNSWGHRDNLEKLRKEIFK